MSNDSSKRDTLAGSDSEMVDSSLGPTAQTTDQSTGWRRNTWITLGPLIISISLGILAGLGTFTFGYGKGASYLSNDPNTCANCHVMQDHFDSWVKSTHHSVAVCNDCHLPHDKIGKWITKADNGFFHSLAFTMGGYKNPIQIKPRNKRVTQGACLHCHQDFVHSMLPAKSGQDMQACVHCHADVGHASR